MKIKKKEQGDVFVKHDDGKVKYDLIDTEFLRDFAEVLTLGANKYGVDNWKLLEQDGYGVRRYHDALLRHIEAYRSGEKIDSESGVSHLAHACCNLMFLHWFDRQVEQVEEAKDVDVPNNFNPDINWRFNPKIGKYEGEWTKPFTLSTKNKEDVDVLPNGVVNNPNNIEYCHEEGVLDKKMKEAMEELGCPNDEYGWVMMSTGCNPYRLRVQGVHPSAIYAKERNIRIDRGISPHLPGIDDNEQDRTY